MASGITVQVLDDEPTAKRRPQDVWDPTTGERERQKVAVIETPGEWHFPPAAAGVTACARLLLRLTRMAVEARGGTVAYWDTDSVMVIATPDGGLTPTPGGSLRTPDGQEAVRALSYREVEQVRWKMEALSPYPAQLQPFGRGNMMSKLRRVWDWLAGGDDLYEGEVAAYATARATPVALFCEDCQTTCDGRGRCRCCREGRGGSNHRRAPGWNTER